MNKKAKLTVDLKINECEFEKISEFVKGLANEQLGIQVSNVHLEIASFTFTNPDAEPTQKQLEFIDRLLEERSMPSDWQPEQPRTIKDASELIDKLLSLPVLEVSSEGSLQPNYGLS